MQKKKNVLLITSDQQHWNTLGVLNPEIKTPNLDRLAGKGTVFSRAYCPNPTCTPSRCSIITGKYPSQHGAYSLGTKMMEDRHTVGEDFQLAGYRTTLIGKAHFQQLLDTEEYPSIESNPRQTQLDYWRKFNGPFYGFEHVELARNHADEFHAGQHYGIWMEEKGLLNWREHFRDLEGTRPAQKHTWTIPEKYHYDTWIAERSCAMLEKHKNNGENFFLWSSFLDPHPAYLVPEPWDKMYDPEKITVPEIHEGEHDANPPHFQKTQEKNPDFSRYEEPEGNNMHGCHSHIHDKKELAKNIAIYYGMISLMDKYIGVILDKLEALGLAENTLIIFTTDHGHFYGQHGLVAKGPFHYEDMIKIPFITSLPGKIPGNRQSPAMQSLVDLAPTMLDFCGIDVPREMAGKNQKDVWCGKSEQARDHISVENRHQPNTMNHRTYVNSRYKITVYYNADYGEIFDLEKDPGEINNLWDSEEHKNLKNKLLLRMAQAEMDKEPLPMPRVWGA
jgi:uncharacterized sulfatase